MIKPKLGQKLSVLYIKIISQALFSLIYFIYHKLNDDLR